jgi:uncharacterized peroxidase-related enzyme
VEGKSSIYVRMGLDTRRGTSKNATAGGGATDMATLGATAMMSTSRSQYDFAASNPRPESPMPASDHAKATTSRTAHVAPLDPETAMEVRDVLDLAKSFSGYVPTSLRIMAHKPAILRAFYGLITTVMRAPGEVPAGLKWLVAHAVSSSAGCRYCQAHTAANGTKAGMAAKKFDALLQFETDPLFSDAERAVVVLALAAGEVPNAVQRAHFDVLRRHFSPGAIVEIVAVISLFGWLNRWNDTLASDLEETPLSFAASHLAGRGWTAGKHAL